MFLIVSSRIFRITTLSLQNGLVYKDDRVVIPTAMRQSMVQKVHQTHQGTESCLRRSRESFFWPGMTGHIRQHVSDCSLCNSLRPEQSRETLTPTPPPSTPWSKVGIDLFESNRHITSLSLIIFRDSLKSNSFLTSWHRRRFTR